jgi:hypothetical protein
MFGLRSAPKNLVTSLAAITLSFLTASMTAAQTPTATLDKPAVESSSLVEPATKVPATPTVAAKEETVRTAAEPTRTETEATKETPAVTPVAPVKPAAAAMQQSQCPANARTIKADVVAIPKAIMLNRLGATIPNAFVFALRGDTIGTGSNIQLRPGKRPRPIVLRANVGDCLRINFTNAIPLTSFANATPQSPAVTTSEVSLHIQGQEWAAGSGDDGSFVGRNSSSLATAASAPAPTPPAPPQPPPAPMPPQTQVYTLFVKNEGTSSCTRWATPKLSQPDN